MKAPKRAADAVLLALHGGPASLMALCWAMHWIYDHHRNGQREHAVSSIERALQRLTRAGLVTRTVVSGADRTGGSVRVRHYPVWSLTRAGLARVEELDEERRREDAERWAAEDARWWREDWPALRKGPATVDGWVIATGEIMACLAHEGRRERTSSWNVATFPPGVPSWIEEQAQRANARAPRT